MNMFGGFNESSDGNDLNRNNKPEISQEAQDKFEQLMGDTNLPEVMNQVGQEESHENLSTTISNKFEGLFELNSDSAIEQNKEKTKSSSEISDVDRENEETVDESMVGNSRLPRSGGEWSGEPGSSEWKPDSNIIPGDKNGTNPDNKTWKEIKIQYDFEGISFENGRPDFTEVSKGKVEIDDFSDNRRKNFVQADEKLAEQKGCLPSEVRQWRTDNKYTWHEDTDCKTMLKVPSEVHGNIPHDGGISEIKNQKDE